MARVSLYFMAALTAAACGGTSDGSSRSGVEELEAHCRDWCDPEGGCSDSTATAKQCLDSCMASAEQDPCFEHVVTYQECLLSMECVDPFEDCEAPGGLPRMSGEPMCESFDNAYARCTCEDRYDGETGGTGGVGGIGGAGGAGGAAETVVECVTSDLCSACPYTPLCETHADCVVGYMCIDTGCDGLDGSPLQKCVFTGGEACDSSADCPPEHECMEVPDMGRRCIQTTPG